MLTQISLNTRSLQQVANSSNKGFSHTCCFCRLRWTVHGVPRVPWEAEGVFDGISEYKLDSKGKIYEHKVTNVQMRDPPFARSPLSIGLNLLSTPKLQGAQVSNVKLLLPLLSDAALQSK